MATYGDTLNQTFPGISSTEMVNYIEHFILHRIIPNQMVSILNNNFCLVRKKNFVKDFLLNLKSR